MDVIIIAKWSLSNENKNALTCGYHSQPWLLRLHNVKELNCVRHLNNLSERLFMHFSCKLDEHFSPRHSNTDTVCAQTLVKYL